jgi:hypothetical protein
MIDPGDPSVFRRAFLSNGLLPGYRTEFVMGAWMGVCGSPRELLTGPSEVRLESVLSVVDTVAAGVRLVDLAAGVHRDMRQLLDAPLPQWFPPVVGNRLAACRDFR